MSSFFAFRLGPIIGSYVKEIQGSFALAHRSKLEANLGFVRALAASWTANGIVRPSSRSKVLPKPELTLKLPMLKTLPFLSLTWMFVLTKSFVDESSITMVLLPVERTVVVAPFSIGRWARRADG